MLIHCKIFSSQALLVKSFYTVCYPRMSRAESSRALQLDPLSAFKPRHYITPGNYKDIRICVLSAYLGVQNCIYCARVCNIDLEGLLTYKDTGL
jgi:hypothetical protein